MKYSMLIIILLCLSLTVCSCGNGNNIETDSIDQPNQMSNNDQNGEIVMPHGGERPLLTFESVKEYSDYINSKKLPDNFLTHEKISQLGAFNGFVILSDARVNDYSSYLYNLIDSSGYEIFLYVDYLVAKDTVVSTDPITNINVNDLRTTTVKTNGTFTTDGITWVKN